MDCDAASILAAIACIDLWPQQADASWALSVCGGGPTPPTDNVRVTDDGGTRVTDDGGTRVVDLN